MFYGDIEIKSGMIIETTQIKGLVLSNEVFFFNKKHFYGSNTVSTALHKKGKVLQIYIPKTSEHTNIGLDLSTMLSTYDTKGNFFPLLPVEEMTLQAVCKELGRTIKIIP